MWIVSVALRRPYTFIVAALVITLLGVFTIQRTPIDIFPNIKIPVVATVWRYAGLSPDEMATRLVLGSERGATTGVNDVEHTESLSLSGIGVVKYLLPARMPARSCPTRRSPPRLRPVLPSRLPGPPRLTCWPTTPRPSRSCSSPCRATSCPRATIFDLGNNMLRTRSPRSPGASMPWPFGGKQRQVQVDLDPEALRARGLSGNDVDRRDRARRT